MDPVINNNITYYNYKTYECEYKNNSIIIQFETDKFELTFKHKNNSLNINIKTKHMTGSFSSVIYDHGIDKNIFKKTDFNDFINIMKNRVENGKFLIHCEDSFSDYNAIGMTYENKTNMFIIKIMHNPDVMSCPDFISLYKFKMNKKLIHAFFDMNKSLYNK